jgi:lysozyme
VNTCEKVGVKLTAAQCKASGFKPGCVSTAAGAYQFIRPTWDRIRAISPRLPDFSPDSQDIAAIRLLNQIGALALIEAGDIAGAVAKASKTWASLPGSKAQQNPRQMAFIIDRFNEAVA